MRPVAIIQARMGSTRLPGKVLQPLGPFDVLTYVVRRCRMSDRLADVMLATTLNSQDDAIEEYARAHGVTLFRGSEDDVLERYVQAAAQAAADPVLRITADNPLIAPSVIDEVLAAYDRTGADYVYIDGYPRGTGEAEIMSLSALRQSLARTRPDDRRYREHVVTYVLDHPQDFKLHVPIAPPQYRDTPYRLSVDEPADLELVRRVCDHFAPRIDFSLDELLAFLRAHPEAAGVNRHVKQKAWSAP